MSGSTWADRLLPCAHLQSIITKHLRRSSNDFLFPSHVPLVVHEDARLQLVLRYGNARTCIPGQCLVKWGNLVISSYERCNIYHLIVLIGWRDQ